MVPSKSRQISGHSCMSGPIKEPAIVITFVSRDLMPGLLMRDRLGEKLRQLICSPIILFGEPISKDLYSLLFILPALMTPPLSHPLSTGI